MKLPYFSYLLVVLLMGLNFGCSSSGHGPSPVSESEIPGGFDASESFPGDLPSDPVDPVDPGDPGDPGDAGDPGDGSDTTELSTFIDSLSFAGADTDTFAAPDAIQQDDFYDLVTDIVSGNYDGQDTRLGSTNYEIVRLAHDGESTESIIALKETGVAGGGTYLFHINPESQLIIEVPHPVYDSGTLAEGVDIFVAMKPVALYIAGTHRCASTTLSGCSGIITACGGELRISDVAHSTETYFQAAHEAAHDASGLHNFVSLHGFAKDVDDPEAIVSNGTQSDVGAFAFVNRVADEIETLLQEADSVGSCNRSGDPAFNLCGTSNVQGRYTNDPSRNACTQGPVNYTGRFLHLVQSDRLRNVDIDIVPNALDNVF